MPNKLNIQDVGVFCLYGDIIPFFVNTLYELVKTQVPLKRFDEDSVPILFKFVWRQSEFAFFGALTSVGALFIFWKGAPYL